MANLDALTAAVTQLSSDVQSLIAQGSGASDQSAVDAITSQIQGLDASVQGALTPPSPPAAPAAPAADAAGEAASGATS